MSLASSLESLRKIDINDLDLNNIGSWPAAVKVIVCVLLTRRSWRWATTSI